MVSNSSHTLLESPKQSPSATPAQSPNKAQDTPYKVFDCTALVTKRTPPKRSKFMPTIETAMSSYRPSTRNSFKQERKKADDSLSKAREEINKQFPGSGAEQRAVKSAGKESSETVVKLFKYSNAGETGKVEQLLNAVCKTLLDKRRLVNSGDQFGRSPIFYAMFKGTFCTSYRTL